MEMVFLLITKALRNGWLKSSLDAIYPAVFVRNVTFL